MNNNKPTLAVFTPAYNRAHTLPRTYKSLLNQTSHDFYWVIVDDGSTDNTRQLVTSWIGTTNTLPSSDNEIIGFSTNFSWLKIHYIYKSNGGMHTAHNKAYEHIDTELAVCIDSDDWMPENAVELIVNRWQRDSNEHIAGMIGLDMFEDGFIVGPAIPKDWKTCKTYELGKICTCFCDQKYVYSPKVIKKYLPYPEFPGERYGQVNWLYQKIDNDYNMLCSNDVYCIVDYQTDGLSLNALAQLRQSPRTRAYECNELMKDIPYFKSTIKHAIQYDACSLILRDFHMLFNSSFPLLTVLTFPLGVAYYIYLNIKKQKVFDMTESHLIHSNDLK